MFEVEHICQVKHGIQLSLTNRTTRLEVSQGHQTPMIGMVSY